MKRLNWFVVVSFMCLLLVSSPSANAQHYYLTDLGTLPQRLDSHAWHINNMGTIVGSSGNSAFIWNGSTMLALSSQPFSFASSINDSGTAAGVAGPSGASGSFAALWPKTGGEIKLGTLPGADSAIANDINNSGLVVGTSGSSNMGTHRAFTWTNETGMQDIGALPDTTYSFGTAVNAYGQVVGYSGNYGYKWTRVTGMEVLAPLPGDKASSADDVNDLGEIVGISYADTTGKGPKAVMWTRQGRVRKLGTRPGDNYSFALSINNEGVVVGEAGPDYGSSRAVIWKNIRSIVDLNTLICEPAQLLLREARSINDSGQITGYGNPVQPDPSGYTVLHAYLLTPVKSCRE